MDPRYYPRFTPPRYQSTLILDMINGSRFGRDQIMHMRRASEIMEMRRATGIMPLNRASQMLGPRFGPLMRNPVRPPPLMTPRSAPTQTNPKNAPTQTNPKNVPALMSQKISPAVNAPKTESPLANSLIVGQQADEKELYDPFEVPTESAITKKIKRNERKILTGERAEDSYKAYNSVSNLKIQKLLASVNTLTSREKNDLLNFYRILKTVTPNRYKNLSPDFRLAFKLELEGDAGTNSLKTCIESQTEKKSEKLTQELSEVANNTATKLKLEETDTNCLQSQKTPEKPIQEFSKIIHNTPTQSLFLDDEEWQEEDNEQGIEIIEEPLPKKPKMTTEPIPNPFSDELEVTQEDKHTSTSSLGAIPFSAEDKPFSAACAGIRVIEKVVIKKRNRNRGKFAQLRKLVLQWPFADKKNADKIATMTHETLILFLQNYYKLNAGEQMQVIKYMKNIEQENPALIETLRCHVQITDPDDSKTGDTSQQNTPNVNKPILVTANMDESVPAQTQHKNITGNVNEVQSQNNTDFDKVNKFTSVHSQHNQDVNKMDKFTPAQTQHKALDNVNKLTSVQSQYNKDLDKVKKFPPVHSQHNKDVNKVNKFTPVQTQHKALDKMNKLTSVQSQYNKDLDKVNKFTTVQSQHNKVYNNMNKFTPDQTQHNKAFDNGNKFTSVQTPNNSNNFTPVQSTKLNNILGSVNKFTPVQSQSQYNPFGIMDPETNEDQQPTEEDPFKLFDLALQRVAAISDPFNPQLDEIQIEEQGNNYSFNTHKEKRVRNDAFDIPTNSQFQTHSNYIDLSSPEGNSESLIYISDSDDNGANDDDPKTCENDVIFAARKKLREFDKRTENFKQGCSAKNKAKIKNVQPEKKSVEVIIKPRPSVKNPPRPPKRPLLELPVPTKWFDFSGSLSQASFSCQSPQEPPMPHGPPLPHWDDNGWGHPHGQQFLHGPPLPHGTSPPLLPTPPNYPGMVYNPYSSHPQHPNFDEPFPSQQFHPKYQRPDHNNYIRYGDSRNSNNLKMLK